MPDDLAKVDSAVQGLSISPKDTKAAKPPKEAKEGKDKASKPTKDGKAGGDKKPAAGGKGAPAAKEPAEVVNINELQEKGIELQVAKETQRLGWKINTSPTSIDDKDVLKKLLTSPPVKKIDLHFPLGLEVTARNLKGVTIKDALDAIHKPYKKREDDELEEPYLAGFEWDKEESWTRLVVHLSRDSGAPPQKKKKKEDA